jgi:DNA-directed RNA polymerase specialized sigma24 family protein
MVELRFFGGLTQEEVASTLSLSLATVNRQWRLARAWLHQRVVSSE